VKRALPVTILAFAAGAFLLGALIASRTTIPLMTRGHAAVGVVQSYEQAQPSDSDGPPASYAVIQFHTPDGKAHRFVSNVGLSQGGIGQRVEVLYDPDMPSRVRVHSFQALWLGAALSGGMGLLCVGALLAFLRLRAAA
jgi:hypothetical protein